MALSEERINELKEQAVDAWRKAGFEPMLQVFVARAIEAEARKGDTALIRQLVAALSLPCDRWNGTQSRIVREAIDAANAWLEAKN